MPLTPTLAEWCSNFFSKTAHTDYNSSHAKVGLVKYTVHVNDKDHVIEADADMPLLWVIRNLFGLKGTKYGDKKLGRYHIYQKRLDAFAATGRCCARNVDPCGC